MPDAAEGPHSSARTSETTAPLRWWVPAASAVVLVALLIAVIGLLVRSPGPLDDPRPAAQRDGLLRAGPQLEREIAGIRFGGRIVIVIFERKEPEGRIWEQWAEEVTAEGVDLTVVTPDESAHAALVNAIGMPSPVDGGPPIGYAVVDTSRQVRYATIDPQYLRNAFEVNVITGAVT